MLVTRGGLIRMYLLNEVPCRNEMGTDKSILISKDSSLLSNYRSRVHTHIALHVPTESVHVLCSFSRTL